tara:strand:+ start:30 stop:224 length:195 start_codon:yes stop_codon:yes gene_type:complete
MCGIFGEYVFDGSLIDKDKFLSLLNLSRNRGPDSQGYYRIDNQIQSLSKNYIVLQNDLRIKKNY